MLDWFNGKKTIISAILLGVFNILITTHVISPTTDVQGIVDGILTVTTVFFRIIAKPAPAK